MSLFSSKRSGATLDAALKPHQDGIVTPSLLYLLLLVVVFILDTVETWFAPSFFPSIISLPHVLYDPFFTTLFIAPFLWLLVVRPLQKGAMDEKIRYETVKAQVVDAIVTIDMAGIIISFNPAAEQIFGYAPETIQGKNAAGLFCDTLLSAANLEKLAEGNEQVTPQIHLVTCHTQENRPLNLEISVSRLMIAGTPQFLVIMRDITARIRMEKDAIELQSRLIQANKMTTLGLMVSGVAHEINNPNNYILANAQLLERSCADIIKVMREYQRENGDLHIGGLPFVEMERHFPEMIAGVIDGTQRINCIINDLKTFSRQERVGALEDLDLNQAVKAAVSIVYSQIELHTNNFRLELAENLPRVKGNSQQIGQVVINLLMNACQSLRENTDAVCLTTGYDSVAAAVVITVQDEGKGIPAAVAAQVMEPFFSTRYKNGGTGLGLSICRTIIDGLAGTITFDSMPGKGTIFKVSIPAVPEIIPQAE